VSPCPRVPVSVLSPNCRIRPFQSWQQALKLYRESKNQERENAILTILGFSYYSLGNYPKAIEYHEQGLAIAREIKDRQGEGTAFGNLRRVHSSLGNYPKAIYYHEQSLAIAREIKDRDGERIALHNLGFALTKQNLELAIVFYKQSVQVVETIRTDNRKLSRDLQASYTETVAGTYRAHLRSLRRGCKPLQH
jgi:tetratricopeptide (TPR) repeat protein